MDKPRDVAKHPARRIGADAVAIFIGGTAGLYRFQKVILPGRR